MADANAELHTLLVTHLSSFLLALRPPRSTRARPQVIQALVTSTTNIEDKKRDGPFVPGISGSRLSSVPSAKGKTSQGRGASQAVVAFERQVLARDVTSLARDVTRLACVAKILQPGEQKDSLRLRLHIKGLLEVCSLPYANRKMEKTRDCTGGAWGDQ